MNRLVTTCIALLLAASATYAQAERLDWMPPQAVDDDSRTMDHKQILPEVIVTKTPKYTADKSKFKHRYEISLSEFGISNKGKNPIKTALGLNKALQHAKKIGANYILFPKGTYLLHEAVPIFFDHKNTIIDLNGATLQVRTSDNNVYSMLNIIPGAENLRITNGTIRGDRDTHTYTKQTNGHQHCRLLSVFSGRELELDHLNIINAAGTGVSTRALGAQKRTDHLNMLHHRIYTSHLEQGGFADDGMKRVDAGKTRTKVPYDITKCGGRFELGYSQWYMGYPYVKGRVYQAYFLDKNRKLIEKRECLQFRKVTIPTGAEYLHVEFNQPKVTGDKNGFCARITNFQPSEGVHFHDNVVSNNRVLGIAYCGGQQWLIENCLFEDNGPAVVGYAIDFEDGWELMQDVVLRKNTFRKNGRGDLVICAGTELLIEDNSFDGKMLIQARAHNYTVRRNIFTGNVSYTTRTGIAKIHDNTYRDCKLQITFDTKVISAGIYRKPGQNVSTPPLILENENLENVKEVTGTYFNFVGCKLRKTRFVAGKATQMVDLKRCDTVDTSIEYEVQGPKVTVRMADCKGAVLEQGPGMDRRH